MPNKIGQRKTQQRQAILEIIEEAPGPITVNEILEKADNKGLQIGIATIYRTVKLLLENNVISQVMLPDGQSRYETSCQADHHHHHLRQHQFRLLCLWQPEQVRHCHWLPHQVQHHLR